MVLENISYKLLVSKLDSGVLLFPCVSSWLAFKDSLRNHLRRRFTAYKGMHAIPLLRTSWRDEGASRASFSVCVKQEGYNSTRIARSLQTAGLFVHWGQPQTSSLRHLAFIELPQSWTRDSRPLSTWKSQDWQRTSRQSCFLCNRPRNLRFDDAFWGTWEDFRRHLIKRFAPWERSSWWNWNWSWGPERGCSSASRGRVGSTSHGEIWQVRMMIMLSRRIVTFRALDTLLLEAMQTVFLP